MPNTELKPMLNTELTARTIQGSFQLTGSRQALAVRVEGFGFEGQGYGFSPFASQTRVPGFELRVLDFRFRVSVQG